MSAQPNWHLSPHHIDRAHDIDMGPGIRRTLLGPNGELLTTAAAYTVSSTEGLIQFILQMNGVGLFWEWTPEGARRIADDLRAVADRVEQRHAQASNDLLAETLRRSPPA